MDRLSPLTRRAEARIPDRIAIVGAGRLGTALATALGAAGIEVDGPLARDETVSSRSTAVLLCATRRLASARMVAA
jgi:predicted dinucleotide-binding enzyme